MRERENLYEEEGGSDGELNLFHQVQSWPADAGKMEALIKRFLSLKILPMMGLLGGIRLLPKLLAVSSAWPKKMSCMEKQRRNNISL